MKNLLILFGGQSNEHEVSCVSAANVYESADSEKYNIIRIGITKDGIWWLYTGGADSMRDGTWSSDKSHLTPAVVSPCTAHHGIITFDKAAHTYNIHPVDVVFPVLHGKNGEDGTMQGLLTIAGLPFVGCGTFSSAVCMNKTASKVLASGRGVNSTPFITLTKYDIADAADFIDSAGLMYPLFVKPESGGSSVGITKVKKPEELDRALDTAFLHDERVIIEQGVTGKEIEVALLGTPDNLIATECGEIVPGNEFYDYDNKYNEDTAEYYIPARLDKKVAEKVKDYAKRVFSACGCVGLARADFFVTADGTVLFNEINNIPGFTQISMYGKLLQKSGVSSSELIDRLIAIATGE